MMRGFSVRNFAAIWGVILTAQSIAVLTWAAPAQAGYNEQMRAYHAKLLEYQVQPGRFQEQRKQLCEMLKELTRREQNVDALWKRFDAVERRAGGTDKGYADECNALIAEVQTRAKEYNRGERENYEKNEKEKFEKAAQTKALAASVRQTAIERMLKVHFPRSGALYNRRIRIWEELKRCNAQKKNIDNHFTQYEAMNQALNSGKGDLNELCTKLENSLALPHNE